MKTPIIMYSYNRHHYLNRIMSYYQKQNYDQYLIIADGSDTKWPGSVSFKGKYLHLPGLSFRERIIAGLEQSQSDLAVLCADDDFLVPVGLEICAEFLRNNPEYSCAQGNYGRFVINEGKISYTQKHAGAQSIIDNDSLERIRKAFIPKYIPHVYAVHHRKNLEKILNFQNMSDFEYLFNFEMLLTFSSLMAGKAKRLPIIYNFREMENQKVGIKTYELDLKRIKDTLLKFSIYSKTLLGNEYNMNDFFHLIDEAAQKLYDYHKMCYQNSIASDPVRNSRNHQNSKAGVVSYLNGLKQFGSWEKALKPKYVKHVFSKLLSFQNKPHLNPFPIKDKTTIREFETVDNVIREWINVNKDILFD